MKPAENYFLSQPEPYNQLLLNLKMIIETNFSDLNLHFKWHLPFYYVNNVPFCYLNYVAKKDM
ncbi:hypothetical protein [Polaribacter tangerinus]|uniref:hypothetical protein n=1 Tax=Polaribacter tangerinus TaxID=1920034 RepID=UPI000B4BAC39|nr:hypothetical protein [Polaribacter tangerinus]